MGMQHTHMDTYLGFVEGQLVLWEGRILNELIKETQHLPQVFCQALKPYTSGLIGLDSHTEGQNLSPLTIVTVFSQAWAATDSS